MPRALERERFGVAVHRAVHRPVDGITLDAPGPVHRRTGGVDGLHVKGGGAGILARAVGGPPREAEARAGRRFERLVGEAEGVLLRGGGGELEDHVVRRPVERPGGARGRRSRTAGRSAAACGERDEKHESVASLEFHGEFLFAVGCWVWPGPSVGWRDVDGRLWAPPWAAPFGTGFEPPWKMGL